MLEDVDAASPSTLLPCRRLGWTLKVNGQNFLMTVHQTKNTRVHSARQDPIQNKTKTNNLFSFFVWNFYVGKDLYHFVQGTG